MYTTIEADIENGQIKSPELGKLPPMAHVLITLIPSSGIEKNADKLKCVNRSLLGSLSRFSKPGMIEEECAAWYKSSREKHDPS